MPALSDCLSARHRLVQSALESMSLDALVVVYLPNIFYLTGFTGTAGILVISRKQAALLVDFRYLSMVNGMLQESDRRWPNATVIRVQGAYDEALAQFIDDSKISRVGFEAEHVSVARHGSLTDRLSAAQQGSGTGEPRHLVPTERIVEDIRIRKDAREVATLRTAATLLSDVARDVLRTVEPGPSEREFAALIDDKMKAAGFARAAFDTIVAGGPNGALPHARPGLRRLQSGDLVVLDFGGVYDGYCVDLTRTVCLGRPDEEMRRVHEAVAQAQKAALAAVKPGVLASAVDAAARAVLTDWHLGEAFGHGTGHGLGIEVHEAPRVAPTPLRPTSTHSSEIIEEGMVFTIEPGAYLPGWGGVRLEDDVLVTASGCEVLTDVSRELTIG